MPGWSPTSWSIWEFPGIGVQVCMRKEGKGEASLVNMATFDQPSKCVLSYTFGMNVCSSFLFYCYNNCSYSFMGLRLACTLQVSFHGNWQIGHRPAEEVWRMQKEIPQETGAAARPSTGWLLHDSLPFNPQSASEQLVAIRWLSSVAWMYSMTLSHEGDVHLNSCGDGTVMSDWSRCCSWILTCFSKEISHSHHASSLIQPVNDSLCALTVPNCLLWLTYCGL